MKTILCTSDQKELIYHHYSHLNAGGITDIQLLTYDRLLTGEEPEDILLLCAHKLQENAASFPVYRQMFIYPDFIAEILSFARECILWNISPDALPEDTAAEKELREIIRIVMTLDLKEKQIIADKEKVLTGCAAHEDLVFWPCFLSDPYQYSFRRELQKRVHNAEYIDEKEIPESTVLRYAGSTRQEIEACAQEICRNSTSSVIILCSYEQQLPVLKQVFHRYGIPYSAYKESSIVRTPSVFVSLAELAYLKDRESLLKALRNNCFKAIFPPALFPYLEESLTGTACPPEISSLLNKFANMAKQHKQCEQQVSAYFAAIREELDLLLSSTDAETALKNAFSVLQGSPYLQRAEELTAALHIRKMLNAALKDIHNAEDLYFFLQQVSKISTSSEVLQTTFCLVTDLSHPVPAADTAYILGCTGSAFPGTPQKNGLFDEDYLKKVPGYPSLLDRHNAYMEQLAWISSCGKHLVYSYPTNDYQGRANQPAYVLTQYKEEPWNLLTARSEHTAAHKLAPETAEKLYPDKNKRIPGSISRIERWFNCPYSYFIESGLKVRKPDSADFQASTLGTLAHDFLENLLKTYGKDYTDISHDDIKAFLKPYFAELRSLHPNDILSCDLIEERLGIAIADSLTFLKEAESDTLFKPEAEEKKFDCLLFPGIALHGIIDRIDSVNNTFRIVDYKSSTHTLSETKIKAGLQLQLLTYLIAEAEESQRKPSGCYYFSLQGASEELNAGEYGFRKGVVYEDNDSPEKLHDAFIKARRLAGWDMDDTVELYFAHDVYLKTGRGKPYDYRLIRECINELYAYFHDHVMAGEITVRPVTDACTFCDYKAICRNHQGEVKAVPVVMRDTPLQQGKEKEEDA